MKSNLSLKRFIAGTAAAVIALAPPVHAATGTWSGTASGIWDTTATNWSGVAGTPWDVTNGPTNTATFNLASLAATVSGTVFTNGITFTQGGSLTGGIITLAGATPGISVAPSQTATINSNVAGSGGLIKSDTGILTLAGSNNYTGTTSITGGTLRAGSTTTFGSGSALTLSNVAGVTLDLNGNNNTIGSLAGGGATGGTVALGSGNLTIKATTNNQFYNGIFTGSGSIIVDATNAANVVNFGGDTTGASGTGYTGDVSVNSGTFQLGKTSNILGTNTSTTQTVSVATGAAVNLAYGNAAYTHNQNFVLNGTGTAASGNAALSATQINFGNGGIGGLAIASAATVRTTQNTAGQNRGLTVTRGLVGSGKLTKTGDGYLYLNAAAPSSPVTWGGTAYSGFTGDVDVTAGVIQLTNQNHVLGSNSSGTQLVTISSGAAVVLNGGNGAYTANQNFVLNGAGTSFAANLGGLAALELTNVNFGNEQIRGIAVASDATISVNRNGSAATSRGLDVNGALAGTGTLTVTSTNATTSNATLYLKAAAGTVGSYSAFTGNVNIRNGAILASNHATALGTTANVDIADGSVLSIGADQTLGGLTNTTTLANTGSVLLNSRTLTVGGTNNLNSAFSGVISNGSGAGNLTKSGGGTLTLSGTNTYTGATSVSAGTLLVNGTITTSSLTTVTSGATLGGSGTVGALSVLDGGILAPGNSTGTLTVNSSLSLRNLSVLSYELNPTNTAVGGGINDLLTGVTILTLDGLLNVTATSGSFSGVTSGTWRLFNYSGALTNNGLNLNNVPALDAGYSWMVDTAVSNQVNLTIVPEPDVALLACAGGLLALVRRRRA